MVNAAQAESLLAASILLLANVLGISQGCLVISAAGASDLQAVLAWCSNCRGEASAAFETILGRLSAGEAARLAPTEQASSLAVLEAVVRDSVVTLGATRADAEIGLDARGELVVVDAAQAESLLAASILLLANILGISQGCLVISAAGTSDLQAVLARCGNCRGEASAAFETILGRLRAGEAA